MTSLSAFGCHPPGMILQWQLNSILLLLSNVPNGTEMTWRSSDCPDCALKSLCRLHHSSGQMILHSDWANELYFNYPNGSLLCEKEITAFNHATLKLDLANCSETVLTEGENPIYAWIITCVGLVFLLIPHDVYLNTKWGWDGLQHDRDHYHTGNIGDDGRYKMLSISVFRGIIICLMAFVNSGGGGLFLFQHTAWDGLTIADIVFPLFMFCSGMSMQISLAVSGKKFEYFKFFSRVGRFFLLGVFVVNTASNWEDVRIMGVLQRFSIASFLIYPIMYSTNVDQKELVKYRRQKRFHDHSAADSWENLSEDDQQRLVEQQYADAQSVPVEGYSPTFFHHYFGEWMHIFPAFATSLALLALGSALRFATFDSTGSCPIGYAGPGGLSQNASFYNCSGGYFGQMDRAILAPNHIYHDAPCKTLYDCVDIDPEGLLSTLPSMINFAAGVHASQVLRFYGSRRDQYTRFITYGIFYMVAGLSLHQVIPINKQLWSPSFAFVTIGIGYLFYCLVRAAVDRTNSNVKLRIYAYAGDFPLMLYIGQEIFANKVPYGFYVEGWRWAHALQSLWTVDLTLIFGAILNYNKTLRAEERRLSRKREK